ncbi:DUF4867 family protein [Paenibacillus ehimensis]|uniref:DUF4867 family protein n=1 Tax=Paenibacillus ehimensis TaxID=79264 RepID=UPI002C2D7B3B|nr:DUF4867 family protein [Paenibacillus ehimensis]MEC0208622.1 DUF4867 family protein [Paenibacillus ehimensis]HWO95578.1 DUF4867 family protein [Bacillus sp. (in: firmicutes)]
MNIAFKKLRELNPHVDIHSTSNSEFHRYGRIHRQFDTREVINFLTANSQTPEKLSGYITSVPELEDLTKLKKDISQQLYGGMPIQIGACCGHNTCFKAFEYHKGNEVILAATDFVTLLGSYEDIIEINGTFSYDLRNIKAFFVESGSVIELFQSTLHYEPIHVRESDGYLTCIILPYGTNTPLDFSISPTRENNLLTLRNTWLLTSTAFTGESIEITPIDT